MAEPPPVPPDPDDETVIVPPTDAWEPESEGFVEESETEPPGPRRPVIWPWLLALPVVVLVGLGAAYFLTRDHDNDATTTPSTVATTTPQVTVPDVVGTTSSEATATLRNEGLEVNLVSVPSDRSPGTVIAQNPPAGEEVAEGSAVRLNVAEAAKPAPATTAQETTAPTTIAAPEPATVPDVAGEELADAARAFGDEGLMLFVQNVPSDEPQGTVVAQGRPAGTETKQGEIIQVNVSTGPDPAENTRVPTVPGKLPAEARSILERAGFEVLAIEIPTIHQPEVAITAPVSGAEVPRGSLVIMYVGG